MIILAIIIITILYNILSYLLLYAARKGYDYNKEHCNMYDKTLEVLLSKKMIKRAIISYVIVAITCVVLGSVETLMTSSGLFAFYSLIVYQIFNSRSPGF